MSERRHSGGGSGGRQRRTSAGSGAGDDGSESKDIKYGASHRTYTDSGDTHFKTYKDALRELVDNSIEYAPVGNSGPGQKPQIYIVFSLKGPPEEHTVAVCDNGRGMSEKQLTDFLQCAPLPARRPAAPLAPPPPPDSRACAAPATSTRKRSAPLSRLSVGAERRHGLTAQCCARRTAGSRGRRAPSWPRNRRATASASSASAQRRRCANPAAALAQRLSHMPPPALTPPLARHLRPVLLHGGRRRDRDEMCRR